MSQVSRKARVFPPPAHRPPPDQVRSITWLDSGSDAAGTTALPNNPAAAAVRTAAVAAAVRSAALPPQQQWPQQGATGGGQHGEPEYFADPYPQQHPQHPQQGRPGGYPPQQQPYGGPAGHDPFGGQANDPGHTRAFSIGDDPYGDGATYRAGGPAAAPAARGCPGRSS